MKKKYKIKEVYGTRIKEILSSKKMKQRELAILLAQYEIETEEYDIDKSCKTLINDLINELTIKYIRLISRWVTIKAEPSQRNITALCKVLNISESYIKGYTNLPLPLQIDDTIQEEINTFRDKLYLFQYIDKYLCYEINFEFDENGSPLFYQIEQEVNDFLTTRLNNLGIKKKSITHINNL